MSAVNFRVLRLLGALVCIVFLVSEASGLEEKFFFAAGGEVGKFIVLSEEKGAQTFKVNRTEAKPNLERKAVKYSPLAGFIPAQWIPIIASAFGALFISLLHQTLNLVKVYFESTLSDKKKSKIVLSKDCKRVVGVKVREVFSVTAAAFILGLSISWTYAGPTEEFLMLFLISTVICIFAGISHEFVHRIFGRFLGIESEYVFWYSGSIMTIITALLGNAFGLQGFLVEEVKEGTAKWKNGLAKLAAPMFSAVLFITFVVANFVYPNVVFQMIYSISGMQAMAEILPFRPMDGYDVRKWNFFVWLMAFGLIAVPFSIFSFVMW